MRKRLAGSDFTNSHLKLENFAIGVPWHTSYMMIFGSITESARENVSVKKTESIFIPHTVGSVVDNPRKQDVYDPTGVIRWTEVQNTFTGLRIKEKMELGIDQIQDMIESHATKRNIGIAGALAVAGGLAYWFKHRKS